MWEVYGYLAQSYKAVDDALSGASMALLANHGSAQEQEITVAMELLTFARTHLRTAYKLGVRTTVEDMAQAKGESSETTPAEVADNSQADSHRPGLPEHQ